MSLDRHAASELTTPQAVCPTCGGAEFEIEGFLGYSQFFDARLNEYSSSDIDGNCDFATRASCTKCRTDVTAVLSAQGVLDFYEIVPAPFSRKRQERT